MADTVASGQIAVPAPRTAEPAAPPSPAAVFPLARHLQALIDQGVHPATHAPIQHGTTCSTCVHALAKPVADGLRTRCEQAVSHRGGPDLAPPLPGCVHHTPRRQASA